MIQVARICQKLFAKGFRESSNNLDARVKTATFVLDFQPRSVEFFSGKSTTTACYNGTFLGLIVRTIEFSMKTISVNGGRMGLGMMGHFEIIS